MWRHILVLFGGLLLLLVVGAVNDQNDVLQEKYAALKNIVVKMQDQQQPGVSLDTEDANVNEALALARELDDTMQKAIETLEYLQEKRTLAFTQMVLESVVHSLNDLPQHQLYDALSDEHTMQGVHAFLEHVLRQMDPKDFDAMMQDIFEAHPTPLADQELYSLICEGAQHYKGWTFPWQQYQALQSQRAFFMDKLPLMIGNDVRAQQRAIRGVVEIGSPGAYLRGIRHVLPVDPQGPFYIVTDERPHSFAEWIQHADFRWTASRSYDHHVPLSNYDPIPEALIPSHSVDLVVCFIGLHHCPLHKLEAFVDSVQRILRVGGHFVLREHDASTPDRLVQAHLAHTLFNALSANVPYAVEEAEIRHFKPLDAMLEIVRAQHFQPFARARNKDGSLEKMPRFVQEGDPTANTLVAFGKWTQCHVTPRPHEEATWLTEVEWFNVYMDQAFADFLEHAPIHAFPFDQVESTLRQLWQDSLRTAQKYVVGDLDPTYVSMNEDLVSSYMMQLKARRFMASVLPGHTLTSPAHVNILQDDARLLETSPVYDHGYVRTIPSLWWGSNTIRRSHWRYDVMFASVLGTEYGVKGLTLLPAWYQWSGREELTIEIHVEMDADAPCCWYKGFAQSDCHPEFREKIILKRTSPQDVYINGVCDTTQLFLRVNRYAEFTAAMLRLALYPNITFVSVAGHTRIQVVVHNAMQQDLVECGTFEYAYVLPTRNVTHSVYTVEMHQLKECLVCIGQESLVAIRDY